MSQTPEQTFELFTRHWVNHEPVFQLDNPEVREQVMTVISALMSLLAVAPPGVWKGFMAQCETMAKAVVPVEVQQEIKNAVRGGP